MNDPARPLTPARVWWHASRPATLAASVSPVLVGVSIALHDGRLRQWPAFAALLVAILLQFAVNYANDYSDFKKGADTAARVGPIRAAASGVVPPRQVRLAAITAFALAGLVGLALSLAVDPRLILVGGASIAAGWLYTGGPRPYGYLGLGEAFVFIFFGLVATCGTVYVQELRVTGLAVLGGVAMGALASAILVLNNIRDINTDRDAGKNTLAVRLGRQRSWLMLVALFLLAAAMPVVAAGSSARAVSALPVLALALAVGPVRAAMGEGAPSLIRALKQTARVQVLFALLWAVGMLA
ncbi:MAG: 1,4-dihydroxy-2-naphthoate polyprenyltransferase [Candidatus Dormibacteria bacterium]